MTLAPGAARGDEGVLATVLPADARALWVDDPSLARRLVGDGFHLSPERPDVVVLSSPHGLERAPGAELVIVLLDGRRPHPAAGGRAGDAAARLGSHLLLRRDVRRVHRILRQAGKTPTTTFAWDHRIRLPLPWGMGTPPPLHRAERYPRRAVVTAGRVAGPTVLEQAETDAADAARTSGTAVSTVNGTALVSEGGSLVVLYDCGLLRVGLGAGRGQVDGPAQVLAALGGDGVDDRIGERIPRLLARGDVGGVPWTLERRILGSVGRPPLDAAVLDDCVDFLVALHRVPAQDVGVPLDLDASVEVVARLSRRPDAVRRIVARAAEVTEQLPRGFGHGDFWHENLLVEGGRLVGVVDWDSAGSGRLPFTDLMHLLTSQSQRPGGHLWGRALVEGLLPWAQQGGDSRADRYAASLGLTAAPALLRALVAAYWLERLDYQVAHYADRMQQPRWVAGNIDLVVDALDAQR